MLKWWFIIGMINFHHKEQSIFINKMNFYDSFNFRQNNEFSSEHWVFIKIMRFSSNWKKFHQSNEFHLGNDISLEQWIFIRVINFTIVMNFHQSNEVHLSDEYCPAQSQFQLQLGWYGLFPEFSPPTPEK